MNTGMPELPDGYFWRVRQWEGGYTRSIRYNVDIRRKRLFGSEYIYGSILLFADTGGAVKSSAATGASRYPELNDENVLHTAQIVLEHWNRRKARAATEKRLLGDYPPNKLELKQVYS